MLDKRQKNDTRGKRIVTKIARSSKGGTVVPPSDFQILRT